MQREPRQELRRDDDAAVGEERGERALGGEGERAVERELAVDRLELDELAATGSGARPGGRGDGHHLGQSGRTHSLRRLGRQELVHRGRDRPLSPYAQVGGEQLPRLPRQGRAEAGGEAGDRDHRPDADREAENEEAHPAARAARLAGDLAEEGSSAHRSPLPSPRFHALHPAVAQVDPPVGAFGDLRIVGHQDEGGVDIGAQLVEDVEDPRTGGAVEIAGGLVGEAGSAAWAAKARASATRCCSPPESWAG